MSKHTPGPWIAVGYQVEVESDDIPDICNCDPAHIDQEHLQWDEETIMANARLIAAAPDLLEALQLVVKWADDSGKTFRFSAASDSETVQKIYGSISKAIRSRT